MTGKEALEELFKRVKKLEETVYSKDVINMVESNNLTFNGEVLNQREKFMIKILIRTTLDMMRNNDDIIDDIPEFKRIIK